MNRISFKGASAVIVDFSERFLELHPVRIEPAEEVRERYGRDLESLAGAEKVELRHLENVMDFFYEHGVEQAELDELTSSRRHELAELARDAAVLERRLTDGTIMDVMIIKG
jgi:N-acetylglutamate synthase-like GNAT family acetyltransferase